MVQIRSRLEVADNTGARMATMIGVIGKATLYARIGDVITANVKEASANGTVGQERRSGPSGVGSDAAADSPGRRFVSALR